MFRSVVDGCDLGKYIAGSLDTSMTMMLEAQLILLFCAYINRCEVLNVIIQLKYAL